MSYPTMGTSGGAVVGAFELNICYNAPCCKVCGGPWHKPCCTITMCCPGLAEPHGAEWDAAKDGFAPFLEEAATTALKAGGCCMNPSKAKTALDADWTNRANTYLAGHGLSVAVHAFYTSDGKSATPHVVLQFAKK